MIIKTKMTQIKSADLKFAHIQVLISAIQLKFQFTPNHNIHLRNLR